MQSAVEHFLAQAFRCGHCERSLQFLTVPLCLRCLSALKLAPDPCVSCGELTCALEHDKDSSVLYLGAPFLMVGETHAILRSWKKRRGRLWQRVLWNLGRNYIASLAEYAAWDGVTYIPQHLNRSWRLRGNPAEAWARTLAAQLKVPVFATLQRATPQGKEHELHAQARQNAWERKYTGSVRSRYRATLPRRGLKLILVDDFWTTGTTARHGASALLEAGAIQVGVTALGLRPHLR